MKIPLTPELLEALRRTDTCTVSNAIESFDVRLRNEGFTDGSIRCLFPERRPMVGHAVTLKVRCSSPPPQGHGYFDRTDWWDYLLTIPAPRVLVVQDVDSQPGTGSFLGEVHANILLALGCVGVVTNGAVRDVPVVESTPFQLFAVSLAVSHSYSHIVDFGIPVEVGGLKVNPGDLLHGDVHGVLSVPNELLSKLPATAAKIEEGERKLIALCRSADFSIEKLRAAVKAMKD